MIKTEKNENIELKKGITDFVTHDQLINRLNTYLGDEPLNIGNKDYCYVKIIRNHLEIGRAKIVLEE
jgi:hypothetical protein